MFGPWDSISGPRLLAKSHCKQTHDRSTSLRLGRYGMVRYPLWICYNSWTRRGCAHRQSCVSYVPKQHDRLPDIIRALWSICSGCSSRKIRLHRTSAHTFHGCHIFLLVRAHRRLFHPYIRRLQDVYETLRHSEAANNNSAYHDLYLWLRYGSLRLHLECNRNRSWMALPRHGLVDWRCCISSCSHHNLEEAIQVRRRGRSLVRTFSRLNSLARDSKDVLRQTHRYHNRRVLPNTCGKYGQCPNRSDSYCRHLIYQAQRFRLGDNPRHQRRLRSRDTCPRLLEP